MDSELNATELKARDRIELELVSPFHFHRTAAVLEEICEQIAEATLCAMDVKLGTSWPVR